MNFIGTKPNQVPTNADLGKLAFTNTIMVAVPASATAFGKKGQLAQDNDYLYVCIAKDTWVRTALSTWV